KAPVSDGWQRDPVTEDRIQAETAATPYATGTGLRTGRAIGADIDLIDNDHQHQLGGQILRLGNQFVAFGEHPEINMPYEWYDDSPADIPLSELPEVTREQLYRLKQILHADLVPLG